MSSKIYNFEPSFFIADKKVGEDAPCFIIAEAGVSHFGDIEKAFQLVDMSLEAKADAVKFQMFDTDSMISSVSAEWRERMRPKELPVSAFKEIQAYCKEKGIIFFATAHDLPSLEQLSKFDPPCYKVGSGEMGNPEFYQEVARYQKPVLASTGMFEKNDFYQMLDAVDSVENNQFGVMHCVTQYPTPFDQVNLATIQWLSRHFAGPVGYSDHTAGFDIPAAAVLMGAKIVEKHITIEKNIPNAQDWKVACDALELKDFVARLRKYESALGQVAMKRSESEQTSVAWARKSVVAKVAIEKGTIFAHEHLEFKRPGTGISPADVFRVIGQKASRRFEADELITLDESE